MLKTYQLLIIFILMFLYLFILAKRDKKLMEEWDKMPQEKQEALRQEAFKLNLK